VFSEGDLPSDVRPIKLPARGWPEKANGEGSRREEASFWQLHFRVVPASSAREISTRGLKKEKKKQSPFLALWFV